MRYILAGLIAGYTMALVFIAFIGWLVVRHRAVLGQMVLRRVPLAGAAGILTFVPFLGWAALGVVFGLLYWAFDRIRPGAGLGSPNVIYTVFIVGSIVAFLWLIVPLRRVWVEIVAFLVAFGAIFGWLLPWLAV